ncbi:MAG: hypothetical protein O7C75_10470 [Verrucomicrobia bacterium]|nr:hypothetical protein [Verrucomicrobiota bacterium]
MSKPIHSSVHNEFAREESRKSRRILLAVLGSFFSHVLLYLFIPETLMIMASDPPSQSWQEFDIILAEDEPEIIQKYVPINKENISNTPDETKNFASRDSQAVNEEIPEDLNEDTPFIDGESEEFNNLVQGQPNRAPPSPPIPASQASDTQPQQQQNPSLPQIRINRLLGEDEINQQRARTPVALEDEALDEDSPRSLPEIPDLPEDEEAVEVVESEEEAEEDTTRLDEGIVQNQAPLTPPQVATPEPNPEDRPARLPQPRVRVANTGPLKRNMSGVSRLARMADYSAEFSEFGEYLERMFETIEIEWHNLLTQQRLTERRSRVSIAFFLDVDGEILDWEIVQATSSLQAQIVCAAAINNRAPFGEWTDEMVSTLEDPERIIVNFIFY